MERLMSCFGISGGGGRNKSYRPCGLALQAEYGLLHEMVEVALPRSTVINSSVGEAAAVEKTSLHCSSRLEE